MTELELPRTEISRRALLRAGLGAAGAVAFAGLVRPAAAWGGTYDYRVNPYGTYGSYNPYQGGVLRAGIPAGTTVTPSSGSGAFVVDDSITSPTQVTVFDALEFRRKVVIATANPVTFTRCRFLGQQNVPSTSSASVDCTAERGWVSSPDRTAGVTVDFYDCEITTSVDSWAVNGIRGHGFRLFRCYLHEAVDCVDIFRLEGVTDRKASVEIDGCVLRDLLYITPDPEIYDNHTHNDGIQIDGCTGVSLKGNNIEATICQTRGQWSQSPYGVCATGSAIAFTPSQGDITGTYVHQNWLDYGAQSITMIPKPPNYNCSNITITSNTFGNHQPSITKPGQPSARRAILIDNACSVNNFPSVTGPDSLCHNVNTDGSPVTIYRLDEPPPP